MLALGLAGGLDSVHEEFLDSPENYTYDAAAVLVEDGKVIAAIEEERLNRIKRSNKFPLQALRFCLQQAGIRIQDIDRIAYYVNEEAANMLLSRLYLTKPEIGRRFNARSLLAVTLGRLLQAEVDPAKLCFFQHKLMHAIGVADHSGFDESLVLIIDNSGGVYHGRRLQNGSMSLDSLAAMPPSKSLGRFCEAILPFLGFGQLEEYKAMMLAPYGDPATYDPLVKTFYELLPQGDYVFHLERAFALLDHIEPRRKGSDPGQAHKDLAASLQRAMEDIVLHVLQHYRHATGLKQLCIAGGMAENSATNGRVLDSHLFDQVFVHPAAYDSGCALGAALLASYEKPVPNGNGRVHHVFWGTDAGTDECITAELQKWQGFIQFEKTQNVAHHAAELIAEGAVVGWIQGRTEFGSHALGNRNVLADPRNIQSGDRVKKALSIRDSCWPFSAAVLKEDAEEFFQLAASPESFQFKTFMAKIQKDKHNALPAIAHVDGTARLHTVLRETNPRYWELIKAFKDITDIPVLLNTSLNRDNEPMVATLEDGIVTFLTSGLDYLIAGDCVAKKCTPTRDNQLSLMVSLPPYVKVFRSKGYSERQKSSTRDELRTSYDTQFRRKVSPEMSGLLLGIDQRTSVRELLQKTGTDEQVEQALLAELNQLWAERLVEMHP
jgi:carbamoyltransferase